MAYINERVSFRVDTLRNTMPRGRQVCGILALVCAKIREARRVTLLQVFKSDRVFGESEGTSGNQLSSLSSRKAIHDKRYPPFGDTAPPLRMVENSRVSGRGLDSVNRDCLSTRNEFGGKHSTAISTRTSIEILLQTLDSSSRLAARLFCRGAVIRAPEFVEW